VRGVGSIYYLAYATGQAHFPDQRLLWSTVAFTIVLSVLVHGVAATPVMRWLEKVRRPVPVPSNHAQS
jgi:sodium/hydrogen antiporter